jgi:hypothetical protein
VVCRSFLKRSHYVRIDEAPVADEHGAQNCSFLRVMRVERIEALEQDAASVRKPLQEAGRRMIDQLQEFAGAKGADEIDVLAGEHGVNVGRAGIKEIAWRLRAQKGLDAVAGAQVIRRRASARSGVKIGTKSSANRGSHPVDLDLLEIDFAAPSPGKAEGIFAQAAAPAQRFRGIEAPGREQARDVIAWNGSAFERERQAAEAEPCEEREEPPNCELAAPCGDRANENSRGSCDDPDPRGCRVRAGGCDSDREGDRKPQRPAVS